MNEEEKRAYVQHYEELKKKGKPFWPDILYKDAFVMLFVFLIILFLATFVGAPLEKQANPTDTSYIPRPEWYFLWLFETLKYFPGKLEFVGALIVPGLAMLIMFLLPFFDRNPRRHPLRRPVAAGIVTFGVLLIIGLTVRGATSPAPPVTAVAAPSGAGLKLSPFEKQGLQVYQDQRCSVCHQINGVGGAIGPDLSTVGKRLDASWLFEHLENPQALAPGTTMPKFTLSNENLMALTAYLLSLRVKEAPTGPIEGPLSAQAAAGKVTFQTLCNACHPGGGAGIGPKLVGADFNKKFGQNEALIQIIRQGKGAMPGYKPEQITDQQLAELIAYMRALKEAQ